MIPRLTARSKLLPGARELSPAFRTPLTPKGKVEAALGKAEAHVGTGEETGTPEQAGAAAEGAGLLPP